MGKKRPLVQRPPTIVLVLKALAELVLCGALSLTVIGRLLGLI